MSFNIRVQTTSDTGVKSWDNRKQNVANYILNSGMDVVCLQEVRKTQYEYLAPILSGKYELLYYERESGSNPEGLMICYAKDFELVKNEMYWLSETPDVMSKGWGASYYRICANVLLKDSDGVYLNIANTHLDHKVEAAQVNGLELIMDRMSFEYPTFVCGDFNTWKGSNSYNVINDYMWDTQDLADESDTGITFNSWGTADKADLSLKIDYWFVNEVVDVLTFDIMDDTVSEGVYYSDHFAISTKVRLDIPQN